MHDFLACLLGSQVNNFNSNRILSAASITLSTPANELRKLQRSKTCIYMRISKVRFSAFAAISNTKMSNVHVTIIAVKLVWWCTVPANAEQNNNFINQVKSSLTLTVKQKDNQHVVICPFQLCCKTTHHVL